LVAKVNETEVNALAARNQTLILVAEFIIIVIAIAVGIGLAMYISRPIETLRAYTARAASGTLDDPHVAGTGWREAKELTEHFGYMIKALRELNENLQHKVEERTQKLQEANNRLEQLATTDALTGLYNRRHFEQRFSEEFDRNKRYHHPLAAIMLDIDHFKSVNDRYGHATGDEVLKRIGAYLKAAIRESDVAARTGGEEFCLLLPESRARATMTFLERVRADIAELQFQANGTPFRVTCSFGVAYLDDTTDSKESLLKQADLALYQAKESGRNRVVEFSDGHNVASN
ncbi:MAG: diguanylate cyclase, partial [Marinobacter sp.]|nr:diguanylate cyclase [Marinobacter sp.]